MRIDLLLLIILLFGCGAEHSAPAIEGSSVKWSGHLEENSWLCNIYDNTAKCMNENFGITRQDRPMLYEMENIFLCGGIMALGCTTEGGIYYWQMQQRAISHEAIHWIARVGNEAHNGNYFKSCDSFL